MGKKSEINDEVQAALGILAELILDISWATPELQSREGWEKLHRTLQSTVSRIRDLNHAL